MPLPIKKDYFIHLICLLPLAATLLNSSEFGAQGLTAYFGFTLTVCLSTIILFLFLFRKDSKQLRVIPLHFWIMFSLAIYIFLYGIFSHTLGIVHYYWLVCILWVLALNMLNPYEFAKSMYFGVVIIAFLEASFVLLQATHILPVNNHYFSCTGTWDNPNVTALFLSLSLYAVIEVLNSSKKKSLVVFVLVIMLLAILLLRCRTAWIVAIILLCGLQRIKTAVTSVFLLFAILFLFHFKETSAVSRVQIWKNCLHQIQESPFKGYGFGFFEKQYNIYTANHPLPINDHINMAYNDFLELGVEGGLPAMLLWIVFMATTCRYYQKRKYNLLPLLCFLIIQLTNFGFQAIPVFVLFLLFLSFPSPQIKYPNPQFGAYRLLYVYGMPVIAIALFVHQFFLAKAFAQSNSIADNCFPADAPSAFEELTPELNGYSSFHEKYGDAYLKLKEYNIAVVQYRLSLQTSSDPNLLIKCGYCYQQKTQYDSSKYYYLLAANMQPHKLFPRMALLKMYEQIGDSLNALQKAREIMNIPDQPENEQAQGIKAYASKIILKDSKL